ncbi:MAG: DUF3592 domain-containing protein [Planctomycetes bacterium]|nr:DUF3592 domain-containing protein [Planctomycetota bacterium]
MGLKPQSVPQAVGLATLGVREVADAEARYLSGVERAPLLSQGSPPRPISLLARLSACGGHFLGWFGAGWLSVSSLIMVVAGAVASDLGPFPILFVSLFIAIGLLLLFLAVRIGLRAARLLQHGTLTWAVITHTERKVSTSRDSKGNTTTSVSYDVSFMYRTEDGELRFGETNLPRADKIVDEPCELMLYDPERPEEVEFADLLPGGMRIDSQGNASESTRHNIIGIIPWLLLPLGPILGALMLLSVFLE